METQRTVMACSGCNMKRAKVEHTTRSMLGELEPRVYRPNELVPTKRTRRMLRSAQVSRELTGAAMGESP